MEADILFFKTKEYERTCKKCGTTWYSSVSREKDLKKRTKGKRLNLLSAKLMFRYKLANLIEMNTLAVKSELDKVQSCPNCGSHNYKEKVRHR